MKLPAPSGFARTSPTARICEHLEFGGNPSSEPPLINLRMLFDLPHERFPRLPASPQVPPITTFRPTWDAATESKTIFLPLIVNGQQVMRRNKSTGEMKPVKFPVEIETCTVTVTVGHGSFVLTATSRGNSVHDSRDKSRRPLALLRSDLRRLFPSEHTDITAFLASVLSRPRERKPRSHKPLSLEERSRIEKLVAAREREEREQAVRRAQMKAAKLNGASLT